MTMPRNALIQETWHCSSKQCLETPRGRWNVILLRVVQWRLLPKKFLNRLNLPFQVNFRYWMVDVLKGYLEMCYPKASITLSNKKNYPHPNFNPFEVMALMKILNLILGMWRPKKLLLNKGRGLGCRSCVQIHCPAPFVQRCWNLAV